MSSAFLWLLRRLFRAGVYEDRAEGLVGRVARTEDLVGKQF
jgi:hypothetical protein